MIVQLDIQAAVAQRAGVGRYVQSLASHLGSCREDDELRLFFFDFRRRGLSFDTPGATVRACRWIPGRVVQQVWKRTDAFPYEWWAGSADVYHFPNFIRPPLRRGRSVVTIHDLSFLRFPEAAEEKNLAWLQSRIRETADRADAIITDSRFVADELEAEFGVSRDKLFPVPLGMAPGLLRAPPAATVRRARSRLGLDRPYVLMVGTLEPRKNIPFLISVYEHMADFDGDLVLAGMPGWKTGPILERIAASPRADRIRRLNYVPEPDLAALYAGAEVFLFPSLYEGFGFPPLEAMACGVPVLASRGGSLPEVLGEAAVFRDTDDPGAWAEAAVGLMEDRDARAARIAAGRRQAARFDWAETARRTWEVYRSCR